VLSTAAREVPDTTLQNTVGAEQADAVIGRSRGGVSVVGWQGCGQRKASTEAAAALAVVTTHRCGMVLQADTMVGTMITPPPTPTMLPNTPARNGGLAGHACRWQGDAHGRRRAADSKAELRSPATNNHQEELASPASTREQSAMLPNPPTHGKHPSLPASRPTGPDMRLALASAAACCSALPVEPVTTHRAGCSCQPLARLS